MRQIGRWIVLGTLVGMLGCGGDDSSADPTCCADLYPVWCARYAECDPVAFSRAWRDATACSTEQIPLCQRGADGDHLCAGRAATWTDACVRALRDASCDDIFGTVELPPPCH